MKLLGRRAMILPESPPENMGNNNPIDAYCLAKGYENTSFAEDAERSADIYMQGGKLAGDSYGQIRKAIPSDLTTPSPYDGQNYTVMKCLEFYESPQLKRLARRLASTRTK
jgi:Type VI secretion system (T6SS), amidase immunity protein